MSTQTLTTGILIGFVVGVGLSCAGFLTRKWVRRYQEYRASRWTDEDLTEVQAWERYVGGYNTDTAELQKVTATPEWVRPVEEHGASIPAWIQAVPPPPTLFRGPPLWDLRNWMIWNLGDLLPTGIIVEQDSPRHRMVLLPREAVVHD
jgi:hypothetical protein